LYLALAAGLIAGGGPTKTALLEKQLEGVWEAVQITHPKPVSAKEAASDKDELPWNQIHLMPGHKFEAQFTAPLEGKWVLKGANVILLTNPIGSSGSSMVVKIKLDPILLSIGKDGRSMTRTYARRSMVFKKKAG
jgi:hypothetical protein